jgi:hypothetical protein
MTEAELTQVIQKDLAYFKIKPVVKQRENHLHVLLNRPEDVTADYPSLTRLVRGNLRSLKLPGLDRVTVYGRIIGHKEYEWEETSDLITTDESDREGSTIYLADNPLAQLNQLQMMYGDADEDAPTELFQSPQGATPFPASEPSPQINSLPSHPPIPAQPYPQADLPSAPQSLSSLPPSGQSLPPSRSDSSPLQNPIIWIVIGIVIVVLIGLLLFLR